MSDDSRPIIRPNRCLVNYALAALELVTVGGLLAGQIQGSTGQRGRVMAQTDVPDGRGEEDEPRVQSGEAAPADRQSSSTVNANGRSKNADGGIDSASPTDAVAGIVLQAEQLAHGVRDVAAREAVLLAAEILSEAEAKAREQILEPAALRAAAKSRALIRPGKPARARPAPAPADRDKKERRWMEVLLMICSPVWMDLFVGEIGEQHRGLLPVIKPGEHVIGSRWS